MVVLAITFIDGSHSHAWGGIELIESAIESAAQRGLAITEWSVTDK